jgi:hypothetical protein
MLVGGISCDLAKAYDCVNNELLQSKVSVVTADFGRFASGTPARSSRTHYYKLSMKTY